MPIYCQINKCFLCDKKADETNPNFIKYGRPNDWDQCRKCLKFYCLLCKKKPYSEQFICNLRKKHCDFCADDEVISKIEDVVDFDVLRTLFQQMTCLHSYYNKKNDIYNSIIKNISTRLDSNDNEN